MKESFLPITLLILVATTPVMSVTNGIILKSSEKTYALSVKTAKSLGAGVVIGNDLILTAAHCAPSGNPDELLINNKKIAIKVLLPDHDFRSETSLDLALIKVKPGTLKADIIQLSKEKTKKGDRVEIIGFGAAYTESGTEDQRILRRIGHNTLGGVNNTYLNILFELDIPYDVSAPSGALPGDSGGPMIMNDMLIGIASKSVFGVSNYVNLSGPAAQKFFMKAKKKGFFN